MITSCQKKIKGNFSTNSKIFNSRPLPNGWKTKKKSNAKIPLTKSGLDMDRISTFTTSLTKLHKDAKANATILSKKSPLLIGRPYQTKKMKYKYVNQISESRPVLTISSNLKKETSEKESKQLKTL
jgi:hypothetical protein